MHALPDHPNPRPTGPPTPRDIVRACGLDDGRSMFLPFSNPASNVTGPPVFPTIIAREQLGRAAATISPALRERDSIGYVVKNCEKWDRCRNRDILREFLGPKTPDLRVYQCDVKTGRATPFVYKPTAIDLELRARNPRREQGNV